MVASFTPSAPLKAIVQASADRAHRRTEVEMHVEILRFSDLHPALVHSWDRLAAGRGLHADLYSSHAWLVAWVQAMGAGAPG